jgi:hypothetical protein
MKRCALLTMGDTAGWSIDAELAIPPLDARGWQVTSIPWRTPAVDWDRYAAVYLGMPRDYPDDVPRFLEVLEQIDRSGAVLVNCLKLALPRDIWDCSEATDNYEIGSGLG